MKDNRDVVHSPALSRIPSAATRIPTAPQLIGFDEAPVRGASRSAFQTAWSYGRGRFARAVRPWLPSAIADAWSETSHRLSGWKVALTAACFGSAVYLLGPQLFHTYSEQAITNAPLLTLRPPLQGTIQTIAPRLGDDVNEGDVVAIITNPVWDPSPVLEVEQRLRAAQARVEAATREAAELQTLRDRLQRDYDFWRRSISRAADLRITEANERFEAAQARLKAAQINLARYDRLASLALVNLQRLTDTRRDYQVAARDVRAAQASLDQAKQQRETITTAGITLGENDRPPTLQRLDEIDIHLATQSAILVAAQGDVQMLEKQRAARLTQRERETQEVLRSPVRGSVWRVFARPGEAVSAHSEVANVLDCDRLGISAIFNQRHIEAIVPNRRVSARLVGIGKRVWGRIARINGYYKSDDWEADAIVLKPDNDASVIVWITLDEPLPNCWVGLKAAVRLE